MNNDEGKQTLWETIKRPEVAVPILVATVAVVLTLLFDLSDTEWLVIGTSALIAIVVVRFEQIVEVSLGKDGVTLKMREIAKDAATGRALAALSVELATEAVVDRDSGKLDGGRSNSSDRLFRKAVKRLQELNFTDEETDDAMEAALPSMAKRVFVATVMPKFGEQSIKHVAIANQFWHIADQRRPVPEPSVVRKALIDTGTPADLVDQAITIYRNWYDEPGRIRRALEILQLAEAEMIER